MGGLLLNTTHPVLAELAQPPARLPAGGPEVGATCWEIKENCISTWFMMKAGEKGVNENEQCALGFHSFSSYNVQITNCINGLYSSPVHD